MVGWQPPANNAVVLALTVSQPVPATPDMRIVRQWGAVHSSRYGVLVGRNHESRHQIINGELIVASRHFARHAMLDAEAIVVAQHGSVSDIRALSLGSHLGRYRLLTGGYEVESTHQGAHAIMMARTHLSRHAALTGDVVNAASHTCAYGVYVGTDHLTMYQTILRVSHAGSCRMLEREVVVARMHLGRYILLSAEELTIKRHIGWHGIIMGVAHQAGYAVLFPLRNRHAGYYEVSTPITARHISLYPILVGDVVIGQHSGWYGISICSSHLGVWGGSPPAVASHYGVYSLLADGVSRHAGQYAMLAYDPVVATHRSDYATHSGEVVVIADQPTLIHQGRPVSLIAAEIRMDEGASSWLARIQVETVHDYIRIRTGDHVTIQLYEEMFELVVDEKESQRSACGTQRVLSLIAISPIGVLRERISLTWPGPVNARMAVQDLIGPVEWLLPDWVIANGKLAADRSDPVAIAKQIVGAAGGIIVSNPDGTIVCRSRFPMAVPSWGVAIPNHWITLDDVFAESERSEYVEICDRLVVADAASTTSEGVEYMPDDGDLYRGIIRVHPHPWRPLTLLHTGDEAVYVEFLGEQERVEDELIQIQEGRGRTKYPVSAIIDMQWQYTDLGSVSGGGFDIATEIPGYSLLRLRYRTKSLVWAVAEMRDTNLMFMVTEGG